MFRTGITAFAALVLAASAARAQSITDREAEPDQASVSYRAVAGQQELTGVSHQLEWSVISLAAGSARVRLRVPVSSFFSGDDAQDEHLRAALDAARHPFVVVEGTALAETPVRFEGQLSLRGVTRPFSALLTINRSGTQLAVGVAMKIDLEEFGVVPPAIEAAQPGAVRVRVEKTIELDFSALLSIQPRSLVSGGFVDSSAGER